MKASKRLRILIVCPKGDIESGGVFSNYQLIKYLRKKHYIIKVVTSWKGSYNKVLDSEGIANEAIEYNWWSPTPHDSPKNVASKVVSAVVDIVEVIDNFKADLVITNTSNIPWGALAASMTNTPHIWIVREFPINQFAHLTEKINFINRYSNKIMANSKGLAKYYSDHYGHEVGSFMSYVDVGSTELAVDNEGAISFVSPNYISKGKNQLELIKAAGVLIKRRPDLDFRVVLMGDSEEGYLEEIKKTISELDLGDNVYIHDKTPYPWKVLNTKSVLVQTSLSESIGRTITEAMKLGVPVIASDIPGHREAFKLGDGTLYRLGNPIDLADKMEQLLDNPERAMKDALNVQSKVLSTMSEDECSGPFLDAIEDVVGADNPVGANEAIYPYFQQYVSEYKEQEKALVRKNKETDMLARAIDDLRNSRAYKIGRIQADAINKVLNLLKKVKARL